MPSPQPQSQPSRIDHGRPKDALPAFDEAFVKALEEKALRLDGVKVPAGLSDGDPGWECALQSARNGQKLPQVQGIHTDGERVFGWAAASEIDEWASRGWEIENDGVNVTRVFKSSTQKAGAPIRSRELTCMGRPFDLHIAMKAMERGALPKKIAAETATPIVAGETTTPAST